MKILNLQFRNISSLKGDWEIRFENSVLGESGIFAITGPVGVGKTSILDAITLALFGKTARIREEEIAEVMTKNASDCYSQVEFAVSGTRYKSRWGIRKSDTGSMPAFMELIEVNGGEKVLSNGLTAVRDGISDLTGLDFQKFSRTILLAQGDFASFLTAEESERFELFEKITVPEVYSEIAKVAESRAIQENLKLTEMKDRINQIIPMTPEETRQVETRIEELFTASKNFEKQEVELRNKIKTIENLSRLEKEFQDGELQLQVEESSREAVRKEAAQMEMARKAYILKNELDRIEIRKKTGNDAVASLESENIEIKKIEDEFIGLGKNLKSAEFELNGAQQNRSTHEKSLEQALILDRRIKTEEKRFVEIQNQFRNLQNERNSLLKTRTETEKKVQENEETLKEVNRKRSQKEKDRDLSDALPDIREWINQLSAARSKRETAESFKGKISGKIKKTTSVLDKVQEEAHRLQMKAGNLAARKDQIQISLISAAGNISPEAFERRYKESVIREGQYKDMLRVSKQYAAYRNDLESARRTADETGKMLISVLKQRSALSREFDEEKHHASEVNKIVSWQTAILSYEKARKELKEGANCPLCGSDDHPFLEGLPKLGEPQKELEKRKRNIKVTLKHIQKLDKKRSDFQSRFGRMKRDLDGINRKMELLSSEWASLLSKTGESMEITSIESVNAAFKMLKSDNRKSLETVTLIRKLRKKFNKIGLKWMKVKDKPARLHDEIKLLESRLHGSTRELSIIERELTAAGDKERELHSDLQLKLAHYNEKVPEKGRERNLIRDLEDRINMFQYYIERESSLTDRKKELEEKSRLIQERLDMADQDVASLEKQIADEQTTIAEAKQQRTTLYGTRNPIAEIKKLRQTEEESKEKHMKALLEHNKSLKKLTTQRELLKIRKIEAEKLKSDAEALEKTILEKIATAGFENSEAVRTMSTVTIDFKQIEEKMAKAAERFQRAVYRHEVAKRNFEAARETGQISQSRDEIIRGINDVVIGKENLEKELVENRSRLRAEADLKKERMKLTAEIGSQENECIRWNLLNTLRQTPEGYEFRKAVQSLTFDNLLDLSNRHLTRISGRYKLVRRPDQMLGMEIADVYQQGVTRSPLTLSGGERFLVSFSMALGLSELSASRQQINSLFLDENFGVLDEENLKVVLDSLLKLRSVGKQIGIITHLEYLRHKIHPHIRLEKRLDEPGTSRIVGL